MLFKPVLVNAVGEIIKKSPKAKTRILVKWFIDKISFYKTKNSPFLPSWSLSSPQLFFLYSKFAEIPKTQN